jgi:hypothetical protein
MNIQEPNLHDIDDYQGKESPKKRKTVNTVIIGLLIFGVFLAIIKSQYATVNDYVGTSQHPGINTAKSY